MKTLTTIALALIFIIGSKASKGISQILQYSDGPLEVGSKVPELILRKVTNTPTTEISFAEHKDKLIILDFWATWCSSCRAGLPKMDSLQKKYKDDIKVILVDDEDKKTVDDYFAVRRAKSAELSLPSTFEDQELNQLFLHHSIPHYVWIKNGIVISITDSYQVTDKNVEKVLNGEKANFPQKTDRKLRNDLNMPFFIEKTAKPIFVHKGKFGSDSIKYRSLLSKGYYDDLQCSASFFTGRMFATNYNLLSLFQASFCYEFTGKLESFYSNRMILEVKQPDLYEYPSINDPTKREKWTKENSYTYDIVFPEYYKGPVVAGGPDSIRKYACEILQKDLKEFTGLKASIQKRKVLCTILQATDTTKICSKEDFGETRVIPGAGLVINQNSPEITKGLLTFILQNEPPFIYEVKYKGRINIKVDSNFGNLDNVNKDLAAYGLRLIKDYRTIDMLVITDSK